MSSFHVTGPEDEKALERFQENCGREFGTGLKARNKTAQGNAP
jgi:hypothetical protein